MKIAIDISPLQTGHKVRGVGFYLQHLKNALVEYFPQHDYLFFSEEKELKGQIDLVHYPYFDPFFITLPFKKRYPTVVTVHDLTPLVFPEQFPAGLKGKFRWHIQKHNLGKVDAIITDSNAAKKDIIRICKMSEEKVDVVYLAASEEFSVLKENNKIAKDLKEKFNLPDKFVLYVGDVTWNKNLPRLLEAIKKINIPLVMVGKALVEKNYDRSNPWNKDRMIIDTLAAADDNIIRLGFVSTEDLVGLYNMASVFVWPSVYEGFGLPIVEAMKSGCPVIVSKEGCMPEVAGEAGYYFDGYDTNTLADSIKKVFSSNTLQQELSKKGIEQAKKFSWKKAATETIQVYEKVVKQ